MATDWWNVAFFIANLGFTAFNARLAGLAWKRQRDSDLPVVAATLSSVPGERYVTLAVDVTNRSAVPWRVTRAKVRWPVGAKMVGHFDVPQTRDGAGDSNRHPEMIDPRNLTSEANMRLAVEPSGARGNFLHIGTSDRHREELLIFLRDRRRAHRVSVYLRLESSEARPRALSRTITRVAPMDISVKPS